MTRLTQEETIALIALVFQGKINGMDLSAAKQVRNIAANTAGMQPTNTTREDMDIIRHRLLYAPMGPDLTYDEILDHLMEASGAALDPDGQEYQDAALIDRLVDLFCSPHARASLAGDTLQEIRNVLLLPNEQRTADAIARTDNYCTACGHALQQREAVVFVGHGQFLCYQCSAPMYRRCPTPGCEYVVAHKTTEAKPCAHCQRGEVPLGVQQAQPLTEDNPYGGTLNEATLRAAADRLRGANLRQWGEAIFAAEPRRNAPVNPIPPEDDEIYDDLDEDGDEDE